MEAVAIVTVLVLAQYLYFGIQVGAARQRCGINAPATTGNPEFERVSRVHHNTLEQLIVLIPALWMFAHYVNPLWAAGFGVVYLIGRFIYDREYRKDPATRTVGFTMSYVPGVVMIVWVLFVVVRSYI
jgi:uncharacterized membrane protein YecN with MAPEG domain